MAAPVLPVNTSFSPSRWHTLTLFLAYQIPLLLLLGWLGPCSLWQTAEYNLVGITAWCLLRHYVWKDSANCMACSLFCTFTVWTLHVLSEGVLLASESIGLKNLIITP